MIGQFNLGFIVCRLGRELFIVDQHASDEKRNFEEIAARPTLTQELVHPLQLRLSAEDEMLVLQYRANFAAGGYRIIHRWERPPTRRLFLCSQPGSRRGGASSFVMDDVAKLWRILELTPRVERRRSARPGRECSLRRRRVGS